MVFLGIAQLGQQQIAAHVVAHALAQLHAFLQGIAHFVFHGQVFLQHLYYRGAGGEGVGAHVGHAAQKEDAAQQRVGVLGFFLHFVVKAGVHLHQALVFVNARVDEILVARRQLAAQQVFEIFDDLSVALHGVFLFWVHEAEGSGSRVSRPMH